MIRLLLEAHGIPTVDRMTLGATPVVRKALLAGEIDLYVEYTGNAGFFFNRPATRPGRTCSAATNWARSSTYAANHIVWLAPAPASNSWALAVRRDVAHEHRLVDDERLRALGPRRRQGQAGLLRGVRQRRHAALARADLRLPPRAAAEDRAGRRRDGRHDRRRGRAHQRHQHRDGLRHRRRHRRGRTWCCWRTTSATSRSTRPVPIDPRAGAAGASRDRAASCSR